MLIFNPVDGGPSPEQQAEQHGRWEQYTKDLRDSGLFVSGDPLQGPDVATTVRVRDGETQLTDGPFAETKGNLAGYYQIECDDSTRRWRARRGCRTSNTGRSRSGRSGT